ncbi:hypothetical protein LTR08_000739 [Meristemomyces frigidus]|nr:hypothetical protein LTR08_000739 [Meristemomyces frigidus]
MAPLSILIVGSGIAGPTLASFLLLSPLPPHELPHITILERSPGPRVQGQNVDIRGAGMAVIRKLGLEAAVRAATTGEEGVQFVDERNRVWAAFAADKSGRVQTGTSDVEILRGPLAKILWRRNMALSEEVEREGGVGVEYVFDEYLGSLEQDGGKCHVRFGKSGKRRSFDIVVGADGLQSRTRRQAFGDADENVRGDDGGKERVKRLGMYGAFFSMPKGETDTMWKRWFTAPRRRVIMVRPHQDKDKSTVFMWVVNEQDPRFRFVATQGVDAQKALLAEYFVDAGWESGRIIEEMAMADDFYYDMVAQVHMDKWSEERVVLLGDAGYCASPISGMGTTLALVGAYNLAGALIQHPDDIPAAFAAYETSMRHVVSKAQNLPLGPRQPYLISPETAYGVWKMRTAFAFVYWTGLAKVMFMLKGPPANAVPVEDYGFKQAAEWCE